MRRLAPLALLLAVACGRDDTPTPVPVTLPGPTTTPTATAPPVPGEAPPGPVPGPVPPPRTDGPVGTWEVDPDARQAAIDGARRRVDDALERRRAALPPERRARGEGYAEAAAVLVRQAVEFLERLEVTLEVRGDGTAGLRSNAFGPAPEIACTWVEEGATLLLTRTDLPADADDAERRLRFRRTGDRLEEVRPSGDLPADLARSPIVLRRRRAPAPP